MKKTRLLALVLVLVMLCSVFVGCKPQDDPTPDPQPNPAVSLDGTYNITMWVSEKEGVADLFQQQIDAFEAANPGIIINASIEGVSEAEAASQVLADISTAPDMFCFAQDQLARLVQASALSAPAKAIADEIKAANDAVSVAAGTIAGTLFAYPMTSDNGYYMYYDTSLITPEQADSLEELIRICEENNLKFRYDLGDAWINSSFFFATGCYSNWTMDAEGNFNAVDDTYNTDKGLIAMKGMQKLAQSTCYDSNAKIFTDAAVVVTGIWNAGAAATHFGENLGATDLPSFTVDGQSYHLGSFTGNKLIGVKPQADAKQGAVLSLLATYLTNAECQLQRFEAFEWGPSNLEAQASDAVKANVSLSALALQNEYGHPQGQIHGSWWDIAKVLGADAKAATSEDDLKAALKTYEDAVNALLTMTDDQKQAWSVIGSICGTSWDTDFPLNKVSDGVWETDVLDLKAGEEYKVRQGASWTVNFGADGVPDGGNIKVEADGKYKVHFEYDGTTATITLVAAE